MRSGSYSRTYTWTTPSRRSGLFNLTYAPSAIIEDLPNSPLDYQLFSVVVLMGLIGLVAIYSSTYHIGLKSLKLQIAHLIASFLAMLIATRINIRRLANRKFHWFLLLLTLGLMVGAIIYGNLAGGIARRQLGFFQPQEFGKYALIIWLAGYFDNLYESDRKHNFLNTVLKPGIVVILVVAVTLLQPAVGTSMIITVASFVMYVLAGIKWRYLLTILVTGALFVALGLGMMPILRNTKFRYIPERWDKFVAGDRYHQSQALIALGSGGPLGKGLGEGRQKYYFLPKLHKDFIFCTIGEEFGFIGCVMILLLYWLILLRTIRIGESSATEFGRLLSKGVGAMIAVYVIVHTGVSLSLLPTTGQPLPFVSYGGSALLSNMFAVGLVLNISRYKRRGLEEEGVSGRGWNRWPYLPRPGAG